jgi:hypothetical protein
VLPCYIDFERFYIPGRRGSWSLDILVTGEQLCNRFCNEGGGHVKSYFDTLLLGYRGVTY